MPPEIINNESPDERSDLYSLGVTFFELLTNALPFNGKSVMSLMMMHLNDPVPDLNSLRPEISPELTHIVNRSLEKDRNDRYGSAEEMAGDLRLILSALESDSVSTSKLGYLNFKLPGGGEMEVEVSKSEITVGRGQTNDIVIDDAKISRTHARFEFDAGGEVRVVDTGSTYGVRVNGVKVNEAIIRPGDVIQMGESQIQYQNLSS